ncbi:MAG TPA: NAD(P)H-hydrate dehydratase [Hyphomonadaceae bacterium]|nr:NAD(P)H-hydrate dehydratase [Hyphomonadaceae bacterium]
MTQAILTCDEVRECERRAVGAGISLGMLMGEAGHACADILHAEFPEGRVVVLAGPGNNGGDAFVAARRLVDLGREVALYELAPGGPRTQEGADAARRWTGAHFPLEDLRVHAGDIVLDGLFGAGLSRSLSGEAEFAVDQVNGSGAKVVAIDVPSGVSGDTGAVLGVAIKADVTVTFCAKKPAHVLQPAAELCGEVDVAQIGFGKFVEEVGGGQLCENAPVLWADKLLWPETASYKHKRGQLGVVTGGPANTGAARLSARAGLRIGAGLVTLLCPPESLAVAAKSVEAVMTSVFADAAELVKLTEKFTAVVIGPAAGVTPATRDHVDRLAQAGRSLVIDADAISVFAGQAVALQQILSSPAVLTPHTGEFERLFPGVLGVSSSKVEAARAGALRANAVVLLKGADTVIAAPDGRAVVNAHATPFLATAGSGDVLAGVIGGLLAQGLDAFDAACAGAWMHGDAGLRAGAGLTAEDLDGALRETIASLYAGRLQKS